MTMLETRSRTSWSIRTLALAAVTVALAAAPAGAQDAVEILDRMLDEYEARAESIDDYTLVQSFMGFRTTSYFVKQMKDGRPVFELQSASADGTEVDRSGAGTPDDIYAMGEDFKESADYEGRETVNGFDTHVISISDLESTELGQQIGQDSEFRPVSGRLYLDPELYVPRRMIFDGELINDDGTHEVTMTMDLQDYQEHQGLLVAHTTVMTVQGLGAAIDDDARAQFEQMEKELAEMPPEQRRMVESMMADQLEQFRAMMAGEDEPMVIEVQVSEVRVNSGPPGV
jgi:hypothetical protein